MTTLTKDQAEQIFQVLIIAENLASDLAEMERAGLSTGFKQGVPAKYAKQAQDAIARLTVAMHTAA